MSKMSQLSAELDELRRCGETLIDVAGALRDIFAGEEEAADSGARAEEKSVGKSSAKKAKPEPETDIAEPAKEEKPIILEDVRTILAEKSRAGFTEQVREIIAKHGAKKLSEIDPAEYEAVIAEVEVL